MTQNTNIPQKYIFIGYYEEFNREVLLWEVPIDYVLQWIKQLIEKNEGRGWKVDIDSINLSSLNSTKELCDSLPTSPHEVLCVNEILRLCEKHNHSIYYHFCGKMQEIHPSK